MTKKIRTKRPSTTPARTKKTGAPRTPPASSPKSSDALCFLRDRYVGDDPERVASYEAAVANAEIARDIHQLRNQAGLTQAQLAARVGTTASVICRLEDAEYEGHSLSMLRRIAAAVGKRVEVRFVEATADA